MSPVTTHIVYRAVTQPHITSYLLSMGMASTIAFTILGIYYTGIKFQELRYNLRVNSKN